MELDSDPAALSCNCSMCGRAGTLLSFVPAPRFRLEKGEGATTDYLFNKHHIHHLFCRTCGIKSFAREQAAMARRWSRSTCCLDGFEPGQFRITEFDGRSR